MATHYTATSKTVSVTDYAYESPYWSKISLTITVTAAGAVTYSATSTHNAGTDKWQYAGLYLYVNGQLIGGNGYFNTSGECEKAFGSGSRFPIAYNSSISGSAGTVSGGEVSYAIYLCSRSDGNGHGWDANGDAYHGTTKSGSITRDYWEDSTAPTCSISQKTAGSNTITFSGNLGTAKHGNGMTSATLYYWMNGATKWASEALTATSGAAYSKTKTCDRDGYIWAYVSCVYAHQTKSSSSDYKVYCYYYGTGNTPGAPSISQTTGDNTITIKGDRGNSPSHNEVKSSTLYYKFAGDSSYTSVALSTSSTTYTKTFEMTSGNNKKKLLAKVSTEYTYGGTKTGSETTSTNNCLYYSPVSAGDVTITDNGNNTFKLVGTHGSAGDNNAVTKSKLEWTVSSNSNHNWWKDSSGKYKTEEFTSSPLTKNSLSLSDYGAGSDSSATRLVAARVHTTGTYFGTSTSDYEYVAIKNYKAPSAVTSISLDYSRSRLTTKEKWTLKWSGATKTNDSSAIAGYRIRIYKNGQTIPFKNSSGTILTTDAGSGTDRYYYDRDNANVTNATSMEIDPVANDFVAGDVVKVCIHAYTKNGKGSRIFSENKTVTLGTVQNAGVVYFKSSGSWKEGQVWRKVDGSWKEATSIYRKTNGSWDEAK